LGNIPRDYYMDSINIPDTAEALELKLSELPADWKVFPHPNSTQLIGDRFLSEGKYLVMKVPSAAVQGDSNYLINPSHPLFYEVSILESVPFEFDERLFFK
jgi:RES domain-containing protein